MSNVVPETFRQLKFIHSAILLDSLLIAIVLCLVLGVENIEMRFSELETLELLPIGLAIINLSVLYIIKTKRSSAIIL
jgi:hypothetical protein